ncbi:hypothetical protein [Treponema sp. R6D11]
MKKDSYFTSRGLSKILFLLAILTFFMPFLAVSCGSNELISPTGMDLITSREYAVLDTSAIIPSQISIIICLAALVILGVVLYSKQKRFTLLLWGFSIFAAVLSIVWFLFSEPKKLYLAALDYIGYNVTDVFSVNIGIGLWSLIIIIILLIAVYLKRLLFEPLHDIEPDEEDIKRRWFALGNPFELKTDYKTKA